MDNAYLTKPEPEIAVQSLHCKGWAIPVAAGAIAADPVFKIALPLIQLHALEF